MTGISIMHALLNVHPLPQEATLLQLRTPIFKGNTKGNQFLDPKNALMIFHPGWRSDGLSIMHLQTYFGRFKLSDE